jgi:hypothetical protein
MLKAQIPEFDRKIMAWRRSNARAGGWMPFPVLDRPGHGSGRKRRRSEGLPLGTELLSLDRARAEAALRAEVRTSSVASASSPPMSVDDPQRTPPRLNLPPLTQISA